MARDLKKLRRHYFRMIRVSFANAIWCFLVLLIPWVLLDAVAVLQFVILNGNEVSCEATEKISAIGAGVTAFGTLILAAFSNHESWIWYAKQKPFGISQATRLVLCALGRNLLWIGAELGFFAYSSTRISGFEPAARTGPLMTCFLLSWLAGFFAFLLVFGLAGLAKSGPDKPFRGRRILSGKDQAKKLASKNRWRL
jgi:hypothetical protein